MSASREKLEESGSTLLRLDDGLKRWDVFAAVGLRVRLVIGPAMQVDLLLAKRLTDAQLVEVARQVARTKQVALARSLHFLV